MSLSIKVYGDYVCPFCFLTEQTLQEVVHGHDIEVEWMPFELRPEPQLTLLPQSEFLQGTWNRSVRPIARRMGIPINLPSISPHPRTRLAFEGYQFAREHGKSHIYNRRVMGAFFQEEKDIGSLDMLTQLAGEVGLNTLDFREALLTGAYRRMHQEALRHATQEMGVTAVPTFVVGDEVLVGMQSKESLEAAIVVGLHEMAGHRSSSL